MKWYFKAFRQYADFGGRASRKEYWIFTLCNFIVSIIVLLPGMLILNYSGNPELVTAYGHAYYSIGIDPVYGVFLLLTLIPTLAIVVRRLHDISKNGWMILIIFVPFIGGIWLLILLLAKGKPGENEYGPAPME